MTANLLFALGTLLTWVGWFFVVRAAYLGLRILTKSPSMDPAGTTRGVLLAAAGGAACLILALALPTGAASSGTIDVPLVWFVMPFVAWGAVASLATVVTRLVQAWLALNEDETNDRLRAAGIWALACVLFVALYLRDPDHKIQVLKGSIPVGLTFAGVTLSLLVACTVAMLFAARWAAGRGLARTLVSQSALVAGSIVFGLPFAFLVITSFKEDRDMSSPNGIVWIPRVQDTVPYLDKENPLYETTRDGKRATGVVVGRDESGAVRIEVEEPRAIRGTTFVTRLDQLKEIPRQAKIVQAGDLRGLVIQDLEDGGQRVEITEPSSLKGQVRVFKPGETEPVRHVGLRTQNYSEALSFLPPETNNGLVYVKNTVLLVILSVVGTVLSSSIVAYAFSRMKFPGRDTLFLVLLSTMMLPGAVTMLPQFLIFRWFGWIDTLYPLWVPAFFASAFNVFLLRQFFKQIPMELEDASKIDGASYPRTFWSVMMPQIKPALAVISIWTFLGAWNNFMGPLIYINSPENMPLSYALQLFQGDRGGEPGLLMAFATMTIVPVLLVFFFAQRYFIEGVTLSGMGGR